MSKKFFIKKFNCKPKTAFALIEISVAILIIGILVASISQVYEMISETSLKSARNLSASSRITRIDDLVLWLDATSEKAYDKRKDDNSKVSIWKDTNPKSISPISSISPSASLYPSYILSAINNLPAVRFNKSSATVGNCMTIPNESFINSSEDFTLYLIYSPTTLDDGIILEKNNSGSTTFPFSLELSSGFYKFSVKDSTKTISVIGLKQAKINTPNLIRLSRIKGSQIEISINDASSTQSDTLTSSTFNTAELSIGCKNGATTPTNFINGNIGETAFINRNLSDKEKTEIEEYLYKKWKMKKNEGELAISDILPCSFSGTVTGTTYYLLSYPATCTTETISFIVPTALEAIVPVSSEWTQKILSGSIDSSGVNINSQSLIYNYGTRYPHYWTIRYNCSIINGTSTLRIELKRGCNPPHYGLRYHTESYLSGWSYSTCFNGGVWTTTSPPACHINWQMQ